MKHSDDIRIVLSNIQRELNVRKANYNAFGKFNYRKCEQILEALKGVMPAGCAVTMTDDVHVMGKRYYVKATAKLHYMGNEVECSAFARESFEKKGMDSAQVTGSCSSYARKYALCGLFMIDDSDDVTHREMDSEDNRQSAPVGQSIPVQQKRPALVSDETLGHLRELMKLYSIDETSAIRRLKVSNLKDLSQDAAEATITAIQEKYNAVE